MKFNLLEYRRMTRKRFLDLRVPDRVCPLCGRVFTKSRSWVLDMSHVRSEKARRVGALCRSCFFKERRDETGS